MVDAGEIPDKRLGESPRANTHGDCEYQIPPKRRRKPFLGWFDAPAEQGSDGTDYSRHSVLGRKQSPAVLVDAQADA